jgi:hypothetical protein
MITVHIPKIKLFFSSLLFCDHQFPMNQDCSQACFSRIPTKKYTYFSRFFSKPRYFYWFPTNKYMSSGFIYHELQWNLSKQNPELVNLSKHNTE